MDIFVKCIYCFKFFKISAETNDLNTTLSPQEKVLIVELWYEKTCRIQWFLLNIQAREEFGELINKN